MADKATLLEKLPPVGKQSSSSNTANVDAGVGTESQVSPEPSITSFQAVTYGSYVLTFVLAGFAAVVLFRKAMNAKEPTLSKSAHILGASFVAMSLLGFFASSRYTSFLRDETDLAPLSLTALIWLILGTALGYVCNRIIEIQNKPRTTDAIIDGVIYAVIFAAVTVALSPKVSPNLALILILSTAILYTVPISRFFIACKFVKFRLQASSQKTGRTLLYSAVLLPTLLPLIALCYIGKAFGPDVTLFSINLLAITFIICLSFAMFAGLNGSKASEESEAAATSGKGNQTPATPQMDPLVAELLAEEEAMSQAATEANQSHASGSPHSPPPQKPHRPNHDQQRPTRKLPPVKKRPTEAPKKPTQPNKNDTPASPDKVAKFKAPSKPKKRP